MAWHRVYRLTSSIAFSLLVGCATEKVLWDQATETLPTTTVTTTKEREKPLSAREYAARFPDDAACDAEVRRLGSRRVQLAAQLLQACVERGDFRRLSTILAGDWVPTLLKRPDAASLCARVIAARAGDVDDDVESCQRAGYPVYTLEQISASAEKSVGKFVIVRARRDVEGSSKKFTHLLETVPDLRDVNGAPTGRELSVLPGPQTIPELESVVLARVVKVSGDDFGEEGNLNVVVDVVTVAPLTPSSTP